MKVQRFLSLVLVALFAFSLTACKTTKENKKVAAKWGEAWYEAEIVSENNGTFHVKYYDNYEADLKAADLKYPLKKEDVKVNDRVLAVWTSGLYYPGTVVEVKDDGAMIKWDDGTSPSLIAYEKMVTGFPMELKVTYNTCTGKNVAAKWGSSWYEAKIVSESNGVIKVVYYDDVEGEVSSADIKEFVKDKSGVKVNDKVFAVWTSGTLWSGVVTKVEDASVTVKWDDGSTPSVVNYGKFIIQ